jgi:hypothetical protein
VPVRADSNKATVFNSINFVANIETIGVAVDGTGLPARAELFYRQSGETAWRNGHPLLRIKDGRLIGSLFNLLPATSYDVMAFDGGSQISGSVTTQPNQLSFTPSKTLYVDDDASPGGNGSIVLPFKTIQEAVNRAEPGTLVSVADGTYREAITFPASGTQGKWIQVKAQGNAAILDSADYFSGDIWKPDTKENVWSTVITKPVYYLARDGNRMYQFEDKKGLVASAGHEAVRMDEGWFYEAGTQKLYVRSLDDPANHIWQVPTLNRAFNIVGRDWIWIEGLGIQYYDTSTNGCGICTLNSSHIVIRNNRIRNTQIGIYTDWTGSSSVDQRGNDTRIEGNDVADPKDVWPWLAVKATRMEGTAILIRGHVGTIIRNNIVHDFFNGIFTGSSAAGLSAYTEVAFDVDVYHNYIHNIADDALEPEGACVNHRFRNNTIDSSFVGVSIAPVTQGPTWVLRSTFTNYTGRAIKLASNSNGIALFYHNTFWTTAPSVNDADLITPVGNVKMRNNILQSAGYSIYQVPKGTFGIDADYNNWYSDMDEPHFKWQNINYYSISAFCTLTGLECHGRDDLPGLSNPAAGDFTLTPMSLNIDRGIPIPGINDGFVGDAPDLGAFEYPINLAPRVVASTRADSNPTKADKVNFKVTFSKRVSGVDLVAPFNDFRLVSNIPGAAITSITPAPQSAPTTYTVHVNAGTGNGTIRLDVLDNDSIADSAGNLLGGAGTGNGDFTAGETYVINKSITTVKIAAFQSQLKYDGWILESGQNTNQGGDLNKEARSLLVGDDSLNKQYKSIVSFDTAPLPNKAIVLSVQLKVKRRTIVGSDPFGTLGTLQSEICKNGFSSDDTLQPDDFSAPASPGSVMDTFTVLTPNWYATELHDTNIAFVNKAGITQFRLSFSKDDNNNLKADNVALYSGDSVSANMPQLVVTYYVP